MKIKANQSSWYARGCQQLLFLVQNGLQPRHLLLDVGCGNLRGGIHFMHYLGQSNYWAIEKQGDWEFWDAICANFGLSPTRQIFTNSDFELGNNAPRFFYFIWAQSVFTHLPPHRVEECVRKLMPRLYRDGSFFATFERGIEIVDSGPKPKRPHYETARAIYPFHFFEHVADTVDCGVEDRGDWGHPGGLEMIRFFHRDNSGKV